MIENTFTITPTGAKQLLCPADVPKYDLSWLDEREQYLLSHGWEREGAGVSGLPTFRDPRGSRLNGEVLDVRELPNRGDDLHKTTTLRQLHLPPAPFSFTVEEAVAIQRLRDAVGSSGSSPLERISTLEGRCNALELELERTRGRIKMILAADQPTLEAVKLALRELAEGQA